MACFHDSDWQRRSVVSRQEREAVRDGHAVVQALCDDERATRAALHRLPLPMLRPPAHHVHWVARLDGRCVHQARLRCGLLRPSPCLLALKRHPPRAHHRIGVVLKPDGVARDRVLEVAHDVGGQRGARDVANADALGPARPRVLWRSTGLHAAAVPICPDVTSAAALRHLRGGVPHCRRHRCRARLCHSGRRASPPQLRRRHPRKTRQHR
mmetsp:Transcript_11702/g.29956  ORF Transcript_11702/g.29956 Transcript_11702/m.29956 type:complete len:211 (-) Transcript_11702:130-762(-)